MVRIRFRYILKKDGWCIHSMRSNDSNEADYLPKRPRVIRRSIARTSDISVGPTLPNEPEHSRTVYHFAAEASFTFTIGCVGRIRKECVSVTAPISFPRTSQ